MTSSLNTVIVALMVMKLSAATTEIRETISVLRKPQQFDIDLLKLEKKWKWMTPPVTS